MKYLTKRIFFIVGSMCLYAFLGSLAFQDTVSFIALMTMFAIIFSFGIIISIIRSLIKEDIKFFQSESYDKIRYHLFFRRSVYIVSFIDFLIIILVFSGILDGLPLIKRALETIVFTLLVMVVVGVATLVDESISRNFNYYFYKASLDLAAKSKHDKQSLHFLHALQYYDKFLRRKFGWQLIIWKAFLIELL